MTSTANSGLRRAMLLIGGCVTLGIGVAMVLRADLGSDGFSTLVNGVALGTGWAFVVANVVVSLTFLALAALRKVVPGVGTVVQVVVVGLVADLALRVLETPGSLLGQALLLAGSVPVIAVGIAAYLGSRLGAGPAEAAALAYDPPVPFRWSYNAVQGASALLGWLLGATVGVGTLVVVLALGPASSLAARLLRVEIGGTRAVED
ncbi:hypothetical protein KLP28_07325 [Nocardioidaceae bacterium]|nr:hypothetical protein KLP28_07325 [Nocardioidaceae bacterium]